MTALRALALVCSLKPSPAPSSSEKLARELLDAMAAQAPEGVEGVESEVVRVVDHDVRFGVSLDEGDGDAWPQLRAKVLEADVLVLATPIWMGQMSSVAKMVLERLDAELGESDDAGRPHTFDKVAAVAVVGNEDGAHHVTATALQALNDVGFTTAANAATYWVGEAMHGTDYNDLPDGSDKTDETTATAARTTVHLARLLRENPYPAG